jgi:hypothetical protein
LEGTNLFRPVVFLPCIFLAGVWSHGHPRSPCQISANAYFDISLSRPFFLWSLQDVRPYAVPVLQAEHPHHPGGRDRLLHHLHVRRPAAHLLAGLLAAFRLARMQEYAAFLRLMREGHRLDPRLRQLLQMRYRGFALVGWVNWIVATLWCATMERRATKRVLCSFSIYVRRDARPPPSLISTSNRQAQVRLDHDCALTTMHTDTVRPRLPLCIMSTGLDHLRQPHRLVRVALGTFDELSRGRSIGGRISKVGAPVSIVFAFEQVETRSLILPQAP